MAHTIHLDWIPVATAHAMEEMIRLGTARVWLPRDSRHRTFHLLKHGTRRTYKGQWGPQLIYWDTSEPLAYLWGTHYTAVQVHEWIEHNLFEPPAIK